MLLEADEHLYERLRAGEIAAFDTLYARYERPLFSFVRGYLGEAADAEDAFHDAFLEVLAGRALDFGHGSFRGWLYAVACNECLNRLRSRGRAARAIGATASDPGSTSPRVDDALVASEEVAALHQAVDRLPGALAELFRLRAAGLSYEEMAAVLAIPIGTVKSRMHEMVTRLRQEMQKWIAS